MYVYACTYVHVVVTCSILLGASYKIEDEKKAPRRLIIDNLELIIAVSKVSCAGPSQLSTNFYCVKIFCLYFF